MENDKNSRVFGFFKKICNDLIFKGFYEPEIEISDLKNFLYNNNLNLSLITQRNFVKICYLNLKEKNVNIGSDAVRGLINHAIKERYLFRWGDENMFIVTREFLDYINSLENPVIRFDVEDFEFHEIETKKIRCPYCYSQTRFPGEEGVYEVACDNCSEKFRVTTGVIRNIEKDPNLKNSISVNLFVGDKNRIVDFNTDSDVFLNSKDKISFIYKKGWLYENYSDVPNEIVNLTEGQIYVL
ncbi:hypothetical protein GF386_03780 [Candidatus Pacearchaeota archaeon]|nr:hypothetical protein [Candidatus Pacearchaeota archaeon]